MGPFRFLAGYMALTVLKPSFNVVSLILSVCV